MNISSIGFAGHNDSLKRPEDGAQMAWKREQTYRNIESLREETVRQYLLTCR